MLAGLSRPFLSERLALGVLASPRAPHRIAAATIIALTARHLASEISHRIEKSSLSSPEREKDTPNNNKVVRLVEYH